MVNSKRVYAKGDLPVRLLWDRFSLLWGHCSSPLGLGTSKFHLCPPRLESLFSLVLWKSYNQILLAHKARFPGDSQSLCIPRLGSLRWGWKLSQECENFFGIIVLLSVDHPPGGYGIWFDRDCTPPTILLGLLLCLWTWGISSFGEFQHPPANGCSTAYCNFGALPGGDECTSFYSWTRCFLLLFLKGLKFLL